MTTAVTGTLGRWGRLGALRGYGRPSVHPGAAYELGLWGANAGRSRTRSCTNLEWKSGQLEKGRRCGVQQHLSRGVKLEIGRRRSLMIQAIVRVKERQTRSLSTQSSRNSETPEKPTSTPLQPPTLTPLALHENIYTLPNFLTATRIVCAPLIGYLLLHQSYPYALTLFVYAGITDLVDGWIARRYNSGTVVGTVLDPMADKALMTIVVGVLGWQHILPMPLAVLILGRDVLLSLTAFYYRYVSLPPPRTLSRYWDFSLPSAEVKPTGISKVNTFLQLGLIGATMTGLAFPSSMGETAQSALQISWWVVGGTTVWSGASYLGKGGVKILGKKGA